MVSSGSFLLREKKKVMHQIVAQRDAQECADQRDPSERSECHQT